MTSTRAMGVVLVQVGIAGVAVFALCMLAVPDVGEGPRPQADESAAIATLHGIHAAQSRFLQLRAIDLDGDGDGEAGFFGELSAAVPVRGGEKLAEPLLSAAFGQVEQGRVHLDGYWFELYLPTGEGTWAVEGNANGAGVDASERDWVVCAWPDGADAHSRRAFFLDRDGRVWACANRGERYCGTGSPLTVDAALPSSVAGRSGTSSRQRVGRDGQQWQVLR